MSGSATGFARAVVLGATPEGGSLALALGRAGAQATIWEPDPHTAERAGFFLKRVGAAAEISADPAVIAQADLLILTGEADPPALPGAAVLVWCGTGDAPDPRAVRLCAFMPPDKRPLVELSGGTATPPDAVERLAAVLLAAGRVVVVLPEGLRFAGWHLLDRLHEAADTLLLEGAVPWEVDEAMVAMGFDLGPYEAEDLSGLDRAQARRRAMDVDRDPTRRVIPISDRMVAEGRLGKAASVGWYRYPGGGGAVIDPLIEDLVAEESWFAGVTRRSFSSDEVRQRLTLALINAGAALLRQGLDEVDLNRVARHGLGFPDGDGGLWGLARSRGAARLLSELGALAREDPVAWAPDPWLSSGSL